MNIFDLTRGVMSLTNWQSAADAKDPAPVFSKQPATAVTFDVNGTLTVSGAAASPVTAWQWQKRQADNSWSNVNQAVPGPVLTIANAPASAAGVYRLSARNGNSQTVTSNESTVTAHYAWYVGFRAKGATSTSPQETDPFTLVRQGVQTLDIMSGTQYAIRAGRYADGSKTLSAAAMTGAVLAATAPDVLTATQDANGADINLQALKVGTSVLTVTTANGDAVGQLTVNVTPVVTPVFTTQPAATSYYQQGSKLEIKGAAVTNYTSLEWQKKQTDGTWASTQKTGLTYTVASGAAADDGTYRLMAVYKGGAPVYSNEVIAQDSVIYLQNDDDTSATTALGVKRDPADPTHYTIPAAPVPLVKRIQLSGFIRKRATVGDFNGQGVATGIAATADPAAQVTLSTSGRNVFISDLKAGSVKITTTWQNLTSTLDITSA